MGPVNVFSFIQLSNFRDSIRGTFHGVRYLLVSGDYLNFKPALILP